MSMSAPSSRSADISAIASRAFGGSIWYALRSPNDGAQSVAAQHAAVPVRRVFAETDIRGKDQLGQRLAQSPQRRRHRTKRIRRGGAAVVLLGRQSEEQEAADAGACRAVTELRDARDRPALMAGQRRDRRRGVDARVDKDG